MIVAGVPAPPGSTIWEQSRWIAEDGRLRDYMLNEPRGGVFRHSNLLVPALNPAADVGFIIMEPVHTPPMSGSNAMCVTTVVLETGIIPMVEPITEVVLEAPGGLVRVRANCRNGKVERVSVTNVPSFVDHPAATIEVDDIGTIQVATAYGGDSFVLVDAAGLGFAVDLSEAADLVSVGSRIAAAATDQLGFRHPANPDWTHISFCQLAVDRGRDSGGARIMRNAVVIEPGKIDRSPTGTGVSARMALLHHAQEMVAGDRLVMESIIGSTFQGSIADVTTVGDRPAIVPVIEGSAWITGRHEYSLDSADPWPRGYRVSDTWPT